METFSQNIMPIAIGALVVIYAGARIYHFFLTTRKYETGLHSSFAIMCFLASGYSLASIVLYRSTSPTTFITFFKWQIFASIIILVAVVWFIVFFTHRTKRYLPYGLTVAALALAALHLYLPKGLLIERVLRFEHLNLPWDESIVSPHTAASLWSLTFWFLEVFVYLFVAGGCLVLWRNGRRRAAGVLGSNAICFFFAGLYDIANDLRSIRSIYLSEFRFIFCVVSMAVYDYRERRTGRAFMKSIHT